MHLSKKFLEGVFTGSLLSSVTYLFLSTVFYTRKAPTVTSIGDDDEHVSRSAGAFAQDLLQPDRTLQRSYNNKMKRFSVHFNKKLYTTSEPNRRKAVLPVVPVGTLQVISEESWWQLEDRLVVIGGAGDLDNVNGMLNLHYARECSTFSSFSESSGDKWSPSQLICLLRNLYMNFITEYDWFVITSPHTYLSILQLERFLMTLDPLDIIYTGLHNATGHCNGGPGIVLSRAALESISPHLDSCIFNQTTGQGDVFLGQCFMTELKIRCHEIKEDKKYFIDKRETNLNIEHLEKSDSLFVTVFPIYSESEMMSLHRADLLREIRFHLSKSEQEQKNLYSSQICKPQSYTPNVQPVLKDNDLLQWSSIEPPLTFAKFMEPSDWFDGDIKMEIETVAREALKQYCDKEQIKLSFSKVRYAMHRYLGIKGKEYIIDVLTKEKKPVRLHFLRSHKFQPIVLEDSIPEALQKIVDFVVPLSNVRPRFEGFMQTYEHVCLKAGEQCRLHLVVYGEKDVQHISQSVARYKSKYPSAVINVIPAEGEFSRGEALHFGITTLHSNDLIFTCDVDMTLERSFLNRCRQNAIQGRRIYYPEVFKYYNMDYVYRFEQKPKFTYQINRYHGHWCTYGYGMLCMYKSDYEIIGGYDLHIKGWGGEDVKLADSALKHGYDIMRAPDPALSHRYHPKSCSKELSKEQYAQCISSRNEDIADRRRLADYVRYLENFCGVKKNVWQ